MPEDWSLVTIDWQRPETPYDVCQLRCYIVEFLHGQELHSVMCELGCSKQKKLCTRSRWGTIRLAVTGTICTDTSHIQCVEDAVWTERWKEFSAEEAFDTRN
jgi:hypothetical protein